MYTFTHLINFVTNAPKIKIFIGILSFDYQLAARLPI